MGAAKRLLKQIPGQVPSIADGLQEIVDEMRCGDFPESSEAYFLARDRETGNVTICHFGEFTGLLQEAWELKRGNA